PNHWAVYWGTGTSSISTGTAFLRETIVAGNAVPDCITVPALPPDLSLADVSTANGNSNLGSGATRNPSVLNDGTLPLNVDRISKAPELGTTTDSRINTKVALIDMNHDGRPDIVIVREAPGSTDASPFPCDASFLVWDVYLNNGNGFAATPDMSIPAPR